MKDYSVAKYFNSKADSVYCKTLLLTKPSMNPKTKDVESTCIGPNSSYRSSFSEIASNAENPSPFVSSRRDSPPPLIPLNNAHNVETESLILERLLKKLPRHGSSFQNDYEKCVSFGPSQRRLKSSQSAPLGTNKRSYNLSFYESKICSDDNRRFWARSDMKIKQLGVEKLCIKDKVKCKDHNSTYDMRAEKVITCSNKGCDLEFTRLTFERNKAVKKQLSTLVIVNGDATDNKKYHSGVELVNCKKAKKSSMNSTGKDGSKSSKYSISCCSASNSEISSKVFQEKLLGSRNRASPPPLIPLELCDESTTSFLSKGGEQLNTSLIASSSVKPKPKIM